MATVFDFFDLWRGLSHPAIAHGLSALRSADALVFADVFFDTRLLPTAQSLIAVTFRINALPIDSIIATPAFIN